MLGVSNSVSISLRHRWDSFELSMSSHFSKEDKKLLKIHYYCKIDDPNLRNWKCRSSQMYTITKFIFNTTHQSLWFQSSTVRSFSGFKACIIIASFKKNICCKTLSNRQILKEKVLQSQSWWNFPVITMVCDFKQFNKNHWLIDGILWITSAHKEYFYYLLTLPTSSHTRSMGRLFFTCRITVKIFYFHIRSWAQIKVYIH